MVTSEQADQRAEEGIRAVGVSMSFNFIAWRVDIGWDEGLGSVELEVSK